MTALTTFLILSNDFTKELPIRMKRLRQANHLTQLEVARSLGITEGRYGHYERGIRQVPVSLIPKLTEALECSESELLSNGANQPKKRGPLSAWEKRVATIKSLPSDKQKEIQNVVDALISKAS
jgi:transcriptional regulator with XRE-family HTH domain